MKVLVINCGSSSLKFQLINAEDEVLIAKGLCDRIGIEGSQISFKVIGHDKITRETPMPDHKTAIDLVLQVLVDPEYNVLHSLNEIGAVGHRIVHGGENFKKSVIIDESVIKAIEEVSDLAPLHNPANLMGVRICQELMPGIPMVAVFDTAFHQTMPEEAYLYGLPYEFYAKYKIRRYGFHGTSHAYVSRRCAEIMGKKYEESKIIVCHLGNGASISAVKNGKCMDTSMGLTPLEGLIMGTRCGSIDPSVIELIEQKTQMSTKEVMMILNKKSGVYGLSDDISSDFRDLEDKYFLNVPGAVRAIDIFSYQVLKYIGSYVAVMDGVDAICFTAGVGENSPLIRKIVLDRLGYLGIHVDEEANEVHGKEKMISTPDSVVKAYAIPTNEELTIARDTYALCKNM